jgi:hypothetical protein
MAMVTGHRGGRRQDGIEPIAGQRWKIYTTSKNMPYDTSVCGGSAPMAAAS